MGQTRKTLAVEYEKRRRRDLEQALAGTSAERLSYRIRSVADVLQRYVETHHLNHRPGATAFTKSACKNAARLPGGVLLPDLSEDRIKAYIADRLKEGAAGRTINAELGELSRAIGRTWRELWPRVKKLEERHDVGRELSPDEETRRLTAAEVECRWHDLGQTVCTKMPEGDVPESTMLALMGHTSRAMLERYSHIRLAAKREAVEALRTTAPKQISDGLPTKVPTLPTSATIQ